MERAVQTLISVSSSPSFRVVLHVCVGIMTAVSNESVSAGNTG